MVPILYLILDPREVLFFPMHISFTSLKYSLLKKSGVDIVRLEFLKIKYLRDIFLGIIALMIKNKSYKMGPL